MKSVVKKPNCGSQSNIFFTFSIQSPFKPIRKASKTYFLTDRRVSKNKSLSIEFTRLGECNDLFDITLDLRWFGIDHAGPRFELWIGRYMFSINLHDHRHWDYDKHTWNDV